jgi:hypothetical protein
MLSPLCQLPLAWKKQSLSHSMGEQGNWEKRLPQDGKTTD